MALAGVTPRVPRFSIIIVNYNSGRFLQGAVDSLARQTCQDFELLVVDNASSDSSFSTLNTSEIVSARTFAEDKNHGFAKGNNLAAKAASGDWLVLLNPDAVAAPDWLERIDEAVSKHPKTVMFASAQYQLSDPSRLDGAGDAYLAVGFPWRGGFGRLASELPGEGICFSPCGAGAIYRRDIFIAEGGFDEDFFCYCEDVDLAFRLRLKGHHCRFLPQAAIHHEGGGSSGKASDFAVSHGARNRIWTFAKNMPLLAVAITLPGHVVLTMAVLLRGLQTGRFGATWRGVMDGIRGLGPMLAKRRDVQNGRSVSSRELLRSMSWNPVAMLTMRTDVRSADDNS